MRRQGCSVATVTARTPSHVTFARGSRGSGRRSPRPCLRVRSARWPPSAIVSASALRDAPVPRDGDLHRAHVGDDDLLVVTTRCGGRKPAFLGVRHEHQESVELVDPHCAARHREPFANPFAGPSAGRVRSARTVPEMRTLANPGGWAMRPGTPSCVRTVPRRMQGRCRRRGQNAFTCTEGIMSPWRPGSKSARSSCSASTVAVFAWPRR